MRKSLILLSLLFCFKIFSQSAPVIWTKSYGGSYEDVIQDIVSTPDGGSIVVGYSSSTNFDVTDNHSFTYDFWVIKLNNLGEVNWKKCYGGSGADFAYSIHPTSDGAYLITGYTQSNDGDVSGLHGYRDFWIIKIDISGNLIWQKTFGGTLEEEAYDIKQTTDGGFIVAGYSVSNDGDVIGNHGLEDFWIIKLNNLGDLMWQKTYGGSNTDIARSVELTDDGGYIVAGYTRSNDGDVTGLHADYDYWVIKLSSNGLLEWQKTLGGNSYDYAYGIEKTNDGGYIVCGYTNSFNGDITDNHGNADYWIVRLNSLGTILWQKCFGGGGSDAAMSIKRTNDGNYLINGYTYSTNYDLVGNPNVNGTSSFWIIKINDLGTIQMKTVYGAQSGFFGYAADQTTDGGYVAAGVYYLGGTNQQYYIVKLGSILNTTSFNELMTAYLYPNPSNNLLYIKSNSTINHVIIYDLLGKSIRAKIQNNSVDVSQLQAGSYLIELNDENGNTICKKFIKQ